MTIQPIGIMFHHFHGGKHQPDGHGSVSASELDSLIREIGRKNFISAKEWTRIFAETEKAPDKFFLTFDDGLLSQFDVALPVLEDWNLEAFWFVYSSPFLGEPAQIEIFRKFKFTCFPSIDVYHSKFFAQVPSVVEQSLSSPEFHLFRKEYESTFPFYSQDEILYRYIRDRALTPTAYAETVYSLIDLAGVELEELENDIWMDSQMLNTLAANGHELGLHSYSHPTNIAGLDLTKQKDEYAKNLHHLLEIMNEVSCVAHPCNSYSRQTLDVLMDLGIKFGFRSNPSNLGLLGESRSVFEFPRTDVAALL